MKNHFGFWRRLLLIFAGVVLLAAIYVVAIVISSSGAQGAVEKTRAELRKQGFKTDLADFNFSVLSDQDGFDAALTQAAFARPRGPTMALQPTSLMTPAGSNSAIVAWKEDAVQCDSDLVPWADFADSLEMNQPDFVAVRSEALSGPIRFNLDASRGMAMLLKHLAGMRRASFAFSSAMLVELHDRKRDAAWTNLFAQTRLVTAWDPEPSDISHMVRFALTSITSDATWEALQAEGWSDEQLAKLQHEWEGVDFFKNLPETVAFKRASAVDACEHQRKEPPGGLTLSELFKEIVRSPQQAPAMVRSYWLMFRYQTEGIYDDEKALLLFFRDREMEMRKALPATSWTQMRPMPGVTNQTPFVSKYRGSRVQSLLNMRYLNSSMGLEGSSFLGRAALAETQRRLILTAIALERFKIRHGHYSASLSELTPELLKQPAIDFMDGQPLRYQLGTDGRFVLYSTGLDGVDNGGQMSRRASRDSFNRRVATFNRSVLAEDVVWPCAANGNEVVRLHEQELEERRRETEQQEERESEHYWERTAKRQASVEKILASVSPATAEVNYKGQSLSEMLRNPKVSGTNTLTLGELLTLHPVVTGAEPETITFEAPIHYEALTNMGTLELYIDPVADDDSEEGSDVGWMECTPATNGNCLVAWHTIFETPGKHALFMGLRLNEPTRNQAEITGPVFTAVVSNICQFSVASASFDPTLGARFLARLPETKADYRIEILTPKGDRVKTISGNTGNGVINEFWDLIGDDHQKLKDESFNTIFHITLTESGRSETFRGP